ncbi:MAG: hypothetical protein EOO03_14135 [Chitinophagaceae bacterium]|nr:MAG: hypothetical protein EOO03_14135 [Chitinophagaceae bacterium]
MSHSNDIKPKEAVYAEQPGTLGSNKNKAASIPVDEAAVEAEAQAEVQQKEAAAAEETIKKEDTSGEAG